MFREVSHIRHIFVSDIVDMNNILQKLVSTINALLKNIFCQSRNLDFVIWPQSLMLCHDCGSVRLLIGKGSWLGAEG